MRRRLAMSALAILFTTAVAVGANATAADAATSAPSTYYAAMWDIPCC
jgi:hypothetical protein